MVASSEDGAREIEARQQGKKWDGRPVQGCSLRSMSKVVEGSRLKTAKQGSQVGALSETQM